MVLVPRMDCLPLHRLCYTVSVLTLHSIPTRCSTFVCWEVSSSNSAYLCASHRAFMCTFSILCRSFLCPDSSVGSSSSWAALVELYPTVTPHRLTTRNCFQFRDRCFQRKVRMHYKYFFKYACAHRRSCTYGCEYCVGRHAAAKGVGMKQLLKESKSKQRGHVVTAPGSAHRLCINTLKVSFAAALTESLNR